jgi:hypothetical protein
MFEKATPSVPKYWHPPFVACGQLADDELAGHLLGLDARFADRIRVNR